MSQVPMTEDVKLEKDQQVVYETPAVIYEGVISTRAGSPIGVPSDQGVDPSDLFD